MLAKLGAALDQPFFFNMLWPTDLFNDELKEQGQMSFNFDAVSKLMFLLLTVFGQTVYPLRGSPELGVALLYLARALGTGLGPILARRLAARPGTRKSERVRPFMRPKTGSSPRWDAHSPSISAEWR